VEIILDQVDTDAIVDKNLLLLITLVSIVAVSMDGREKVLKCNDKPATGRECLAAT